MNKKLLYVLPLLAVVLVSAGLIEHYGLFQQDIEVNQPIEVIGDTSQSIPCEAGQTCDGSEITISNEGTQEIDVVISDSYEEGIKTTYNGELILSKKEVDFSKDVWDLISGDEVTISYAVVGDEFSSEVIDNAKEGYVLIYYKDNSDRFNSPAQAILIEDVEGNLPYEDDKNNDEYNYCDTGEYLTCHGGKIWYVPSDAITGGNLDWSRASEFYYETELIQYSDGIITTYPNNVLTITPSYELDVALEEGTYTIETQINPIA